MMFQGFPQIISYTEKDEIYTVEVIAASLNPSDEMNFTFKLTDVSYESFPLNKETVVLISEIVKPYIYIFEKAEGGHFCPYRIFILMKFKKARFFGLFSFV